MKCAICGKKRDVYDFKETLKLLEYSGTHAHPECVVIEKNKAIAKLKRQAKAWLRK